MRIDWKTISLEDLAGLLSEELRKKGIEIILVGGACVTIYSKNRYQSYDLDFVTYEDLSKVKQTLKLLNFEESSGYFRHKNCPWIVEFVSPPVAVGDEPITKFSKRKTDMGTVKMLRAIDSIKDRLASYYHWEDRQGLEQAVDICLEVPKINFNELKRWSKNEGYLEKFQQFLSFFKEQKKKYRG
ncbi:hypothetical protein JYU14_02615 [Simkania negevensis]|uniref:Uncharacterized protein n=1 Tax=Simkania negevensis TaxID=83561 RepID=A0ABS3AQF7_9BACT|nr:hypothetical protein [Simkania negevensis]